MLQAWGGKTNLHSLFQPAMGDLFGSAAQPGGDIVCVRPPRGLAGRWESKGSCATHLGGWLWALKPTLPCQAARTLQWLWASSERFGVNGVKDARDFHSCIATVATQGRPDQLTAKVHRPPYPAPVMASKRSGGRRVRTEHRRRFSSAGRCPACSQPAGTRARTLPSPSCSSGTEHSRQGARTCIYLLTQAELGCKEQVKLHENDCDQLELISPRVTPNLRAQALL